MTPSPKHLLALPLALLGLAAVPGIALGAAESAGGAPPAGGAAIDQVVIATAGAVLLTSALLFLGIGHRSGRVSLLGWAADLSERISGLPGWAALPAAVIAPSLVGALFGMMWDISLHAGEGRDEGPLANPAHYFILAGLFGVFAAGYIAMVLPRERPSVTSIRIAGDWHAPLGGVLIAACGSFSLIGFPLDDVWHRLFGQDVTLWGPTHLMLLGGAAMTLIGLAVLLVEGKRARPDGRPSRDRAARGREAEHAARIEVDWIAWLMRVALTGAFLLGLSIFQAEFDFGFPQFRLVFQPMLIMLAAGAALVAARVWLGRGAALGAALFFIAVRGSIAVLVGPVLGEAFPHFPLYLTEAAIVELVALGVSPRRPLAFGLASGALLGTIGLAAEWGWANLGMALPWPAELLPEGAILGFAMAVLGAVIGAWIGARLASDELPRTPSLRIAAAVAAAAVAALIGLNLYQPADTGIRGTVALEEVRGEPERTVAATVRLTPRDAAEEADWLSAFAWQGGGIVIDQLEEVGPGTYRTTEPIPVHHDWKSGIRLHQGGSLISIPLYMPEDPAIPAEGISAPERFSRVFVDETQILQREQKPGVSDSLTAIGYATVLAITLGFLALLAWGLHRLALAAESRPQAREQRRRAGVTKERPGRPVAARP